MYLKRRTSPIVKQRIAELCFKLQEHLEGRERLKDFKPDYGLCRHYYDLYRNLGGGAGNILYYQWSGGTNAPFNRDGLFYSDEQASNKVYSNKKRLAFIKRWAKKHNQFY